jgi:hypothetical protein
MPPPSLPPGVAAASLQPKRAADQSNTLTVGLTGIRRLQVILRVSTDTRGERNEVWWTLSAWATLATPIDGVEHVTVAPSLLDVAPLTAPVMHVATVFWPAEPVASALSVRFSTAADIPQGWAAAYGVGDTTPHDRAGLFLAPYGYTRQPRRLVEPLVDPDLKLSDITVLELLQVLDRLPPPRLPLVRTKRR